MDQQDKAVTDPDGIRLFKCKYCGKISTEKDFINYGGPGQINLGTCRDCNKNNEELAKERREKLSAINAKRDNRTMTCPDCGGELRVKTGKYGDFLGCSNFPNCRFTSQLRKI
ncbi:MAG: topoisomerase DNA-binding C4 zinc finger domain-containing protein [Lachnospiraceae bacterium]|nr:topoisomerase DNA-binding C4 zinc finger domain-containing protein [Lachnospiraceae bacterium]